MEALRTVVVVAVVVVTGVGAARVGRILVGKAEEGMLLQSRRHLLGLLRLLQSIVEEALVIKVGVIADRRRNVGLRRNVIQRC